MDNQSLGDAETNCTNATSRYVNPIYDLNKEDSNWIVTSSFIIFTMQTGKSAKSYMTFFVKTDR